MNGNGMNTTGSQYGYDNRNGNGNGRRGSPLPPLGGMDLSTPSMNATPVSSLHGLLTPNSGGQHDVVSPSSSASGIQSGSSHSAISTGTPYSSNSWNTNSSSSAFGFPSSSNSVGPISDSHPYDNKPSSFDSNSSGGTMYTVRPPSLGSANHMSSYGQHSQHHQPAASYPGVYGHGNTTPGASSSHPSHSSITATSPGGIMGHSNSAASQPPTPSSAGPHDPYSRTTSYFPTPGTPHQSSFPSSAAPHQSSFSTSAAPHHSSFSTSAPPHQSSFPASTGPHQSSFPAFAHSNPSPTGLSLGASRSLHPSTGMAPPQGFRAPPYSGFGLALPSNPIMSNLGNPGGPMSVMSGMPVPYGHHMPQGMYGHAVTQPERPYKCQQCPQSFNRNHDLKRHTRIHLSVKPFPCGSCDKAFSRKDALKRHRLVKGCGDPGDAETATTHDGSGRSDASASESPTNIRQE